MDLPASIPMDVAVSFEHLALDVHRRGWERFSADALLHKIRWETQVERGERSFKCNNNWTAALARWFLDRHPEMEGFFNLRGVRTG